MTTIEEEAMDEFFNFDDAAHSLAQHNFDFGNLEAGPYDIDLVFNEPENDEDSFTALQHFSAPEQQFDLHDTTMMGPDDFTDFARWIEGSGFPSKPCAYCSRMRIHCKILKEGVRKGSCTSCVALARSCSLTHPGPSNNDGQDFDLQINDVAEYDVNDQWSDSQIPQDIGDWNMEDNILPSDAPLASPMRPEFPESRSSSNVGSLKSSNENLNALHHESNPKIGARFSREAIKVLRNWLSTHHSHPYPTDEEKESLRRQTGLNKTQITNWLANARRRGKVRPPRSVSPNVGNMANAMDIPRRATPALENMNPLERWKNSPPENEPAAITAIAKAVTSSTYSSGGLDSPFTAYGHSATDDGSNRSLCNVSSTSSLGTSHSSGNSFASAFSYKSRGSFGSFGSFGQRGRRRRRRPAPKPVKVDVMTAPARTYQCTFCTETFKTKHDWQRHEKSLHLSLERWVCCPEGRAHQYCHDYGHNRCVFCGLPNPPEEHAEVHNYSSCAERSLEERTFYRKDHLRQHLNLVHDVKFQSFSMETWKVVTPEIRSRCGFCGVVLDTWSIRVDHLAEHFKGGKSMADWKGDWGFEPEILDIVENGMPPYLIHDERNTMNPYEASKESAEDEKTLEDLVKIGLVEYINNVLLKGGVPTDEDLLREARIIVRRADSFTVAPKLPQVSWFRDLIMIYECEEQEYCDGPRSSPLSWGERLDRITQLAPHDTTNLHAIGCPKERALMTWVKSRQMLGLTPTDRELQVECTKILDDVENTSNFKAKGAVGWFKYLIRADTTWLRDFRRRANLPRSSEMAMEHIRSKDDKSIDYSIHNFARLEHELRDWCQFQIALGNTPSDGDIQRQARLIVYKSDDPWNQTAVDDLPTLHLFKRQNGLAPADDNGVDTMHLPPLSESTDMPMNAPSPKALHWDLEHTGIGNPSPNSQYNGAGVIAPNIVDKPLHTLIQNQPSTNTNPVQPLKYFLNDANCYGRLVRELSRFVTSCMSPNNPLQHVPTDAEIQNQARWIIYDDDDPWNQTAADNAEWLTRFKRDVGLSPAEDGPGLPLNIGSWRLSAGGSGFSPPYLCPQSVPAAPYVDDVPVTVKHRTYNVKASTAQKFVKSVSQRFEKPATIFCSREMENELTSYVKTELSRGVTPSDQALRMKAREVLGVDRTGADEPALLQKFKVMVGIARNASPLASTLPPIDDALLAEYDNEIGNMDLSGIEMPGSVSPILDSIPGALEQPRTTPSPTAVSQGHSPMSVLQQHSPTHHSPTSVIYQQHSPTHQQHSPSKGPGLAQDYAELYRVSAATASPLRRHASAKMAGQAGYACPPQTQNRSPLGISPPSTTAALSFPEEG